MAQDFSVDKIGLKNKTYFLGDISEPQKEVSAPKQDENDKKLSKSAKYMIGATALATAVVAGIAIARNIKKGKALEAARKAHEAAEIEHQKIIQKAQNIIDKEKDIHSAIEKEDRYFNKTYNKINKSARNSAETFDTYYKKQECIANVKKSLRQKTPINAETIDTRLKPELKEGAWAKEDMKAYYESDCVQVYKSNLCTSYKNFSADGKLVKEKRIYTASSEYGEGATEIITKNKNGTEISEIKTPDGKLIESRVYKPFGEFEVRKYFENGKLSKIVSKDKNGETKTIFTDGIKTSMHKNNDGSQVFKIYEQDKNGKYHCISRRTNNHDAYGDFDDTKTVEYINNGKYSKTQTGSSSRISEIRSTVVRDLKGNIIDESKINVPKSGKSKPSKGTSGAAGAKGADGTQDAGELLASWYKDYLKLCEKYGESVRECGVKGGAGDHWFELCLRRNDEKAYESYLRMQEYRARYDENAMFALIMRMASKEHINLSPEKLSKLSKEELKTVSKFFKEGFIDVEDLNNLSSKNIKKIIENELDKGNGFKVEKNDVMDDELKMKEHGVVSRNKGKSIIINDPDHKLIISHGNPYRTSYTPSRTKEREVTVYK